jgi:molecular chaperone DnaK
VDFEFTLSPPQLASIAEPFIRTSIELSKKALAEKQLPLSAIERVLLVGGTSLLPTAREALQSELKAPIDLTVNPLEAVARGAAAFAGTRRLESGRAAVVPSSVIQLELLYDPVGSALDFPIGGRFRHPGGKTLNGFTAQITESKSRWRSGRIALDQNGSFLTEAHGERGRLCEFLVELFDGQGNRQATDPTGFTYTVGNVIAGAPLTHNIGVAMANNKPDWFFKKGQSLPARRRLVHRAVQGLKKGAAGQVLNIPVVEGEHDHRADLNPLIGYLVISATDPRLHRDVPPGAEVEITLVIDESRVLRVEAYIPVIDGHFDVELNPAAYQPRDAAKIRADIDCQVSLLKELTAQARLAAAANAFPPERRAEAERLVKRVSDLSVSAQGDIDAAVEAEKRLLELKGKLDEGERLLAWPAAVKEAQQSLEETRGLIAEGGTADDKRILAETEQKLQHALGAHDHDLLKDGIDELRSLGFRILGARLEFWVGYLQYLEGKRDAMQDKPLADRLFAQGKKSADGKDLPGLRAAVRQLLSLLPQQEQAEAQYRGYDGRTQRSA